MNFKKEFPILNDIIYFDNGAATLKPVSVIKAIDNFYRTYPINPHSPNSPLGIKVKKAINNARKLVASFCDAKPSEVIFTSGTTEGLNMIALMLKKKLKHGDEVIISRFNHNSNIIPWFILEKEIGIKVIISKTIEKDVTNKTKVIVVSQKNNAIGININLKKLYEYAKAKKIVLINDAAQAAAIEAISITSADVIAITANKIYGPTGIGALIVKESLLKDLKPIKFGGEGVASINENHQFDLKPGISQFEVGTPNTAGIIGFKAALEFFNNTKAGISKVKELAIYAYKKLQALQGIKLYTKLKEIVIIFDYKQCPAQDIVSKLAHKYSIYLRAGAFCSHLSNDNREGKIRMSLGIYNTKDEIDKLIEILKKEDFYILD